jgi:dipeptidyl aminopeptidase/acylaminoacyl peptidase
MAVASNLALREPRLDDEDVYWIEGRPAEEGRQVVVRWSRNTGVADVSPAGFNARTMAHEYGGGSYAVSDRKVYFTNLGDGRIYRQDDGGEPVALTPVGPYRYGDLVVDRARGRLLCVREDLSKLIDASPTADGDRGPEPDETLIAVDPGSGVATVLASGSDFYSTPRPTTDGRRLAWLSWRHPNMPWDATELWVADVDDEGTLANTHMVAGGGEESIVQPEWAPDGSLVFASDRTGWWNLYRWAAGAAEPKALAPMEAEFAGPQWVFGMRWYGIGPDGTIVAAVRHGGGDELWILPTGGGRPERIAVPDDGIDSVSVGARCVLYLGSSSEAARAVVLLDLASRQRRVLRESLDVTVRSGYISQPEQITFPTSHGATAHALFYAPASADYDGPPDERPPLIVTIHGGPTSHAGGALDLGKQFFTSRGFAVVDVDYRGSSGYGREYMRSLDGQWGVYDVDDVVAAAGFLSRRGDVDVKRMAIRGGSAGGYTTLAALCFHDVFAAGASHYGVGDLAALARYTHKFESRYLDRLVAPYPAGMDVYRERSPIYFIDRIRSPLLVLQGRDDKVVPVAQAEDLVASLRERRIPYAYLVFDGEGHGFRQGKNIRRSLEAEISFYAQLFGFALADPIEPIEVEFLPA